MNSGSFSGVWALASTVSVTSKVLVSNCRVVTLTLSVSCGCFCSIRLCGARGFSKLKSLMYWPWMVSGPAWACWLGSALGGGGVVVMVYFQWFGRRAVACRAALHKARAGAGLGQLPSDRALAMIKALCIVRLYVPWLASLPVSRKTAAAAGTTRWATNISRP